MNLVIIEGIGKKDTIKKYLGSDYEVVATKGHVRDLPEKLLGVDIQHNFEPQYEIMPDKKEIVASLKDKAKKADKIYLATDPDREGEAISWHLCNILGLNEKDPIRITFNEISKNAVNKGLQNPRGIDIKLVNAQQARRVLDRLVGYKISPILCKKIQPKLSAGRVQSVALKLVVDREHEINNFKPTEYWNLSASLYPNNPKDLFKANLVKINGKKASVGNKEQMDKVIEELQQNTFKVASVKRSLAKTHASAPFTTSTMQQEALNKLGFNLKKASFCAQELYEGVSLGEEGKVALITYIRTGSVRVAPEAMEMAKDYIQQTFGAKYVPSKPNVYKSKSSAQDAHEAIRPISLDRTPEKVKPYLSADNYKLYKLIYNKFLASQMAEATYNSVVAEINNGIYNFKASGKTPVFDGFMAVYNQDKKSKQQPQTEDSEENFEEAIILRERIKALTTVQRHSNLEYAGLKSVDVIGIAEKDNWFCIEIFFIRGGKNCGNAPYFIKKVEDSTINEVLEAFISRFYANHLVPKEIFISEELEGKEFLEEALSVKINTYTRGNKNKIIENTKKNAKEALERKLAETQSIKNNLKEMTDVFGLPKIPERIEIYDNSHNQGSYAIWLHRLCDAS